MKVINNKKGSAMLWAILLVVILTILLGAITTSSYAYFNYTIRSVKKQQAYFTARSAMSALLEQYTTIDLDHKQDAGSNVYSYDEENNPLIPLKGEEIKVLDFGFDEDQMGSATGTIKANAKDPDMIDVVIVAKFRDTEYTMKSTVGRQPIYFGGVAIKNMALGVGSSFELDPGTDFYYYTYKNKEEMGNKKANTFDTAKICVSGSTITIHGNVITQGDAKLDRHITAAGYHFKTPVEFTLKTDGHSRKIWNSEQYIISNRTFPLDDKLAEHPLTVRKLLTEPGNCSFYYCNNSKNNKNNAFGRNLPDGITTLLNALMHPSLPGGVSFDVSELINGFGIGKEVLNMLGDNNVENLAVIDSNNNGLATRYIEILSLANTISESLDDTAAYISSFLDGIPNIFGLKDTIVRLFVSPLENIAKAVNENGLTVMDISYIDFDSSNTGNFGDSNVVPVTYLNVGGNPLESGGIDVRIKYGTNPGSQATINQIGDSIKKGIDNLASRWLKIVKNTSYVNVYLGENATLELGVENPKISMLANEPAKTEANQVYFMSVYGQPGSKVVLNDKVHVFGEIMCDNIEINGDVAITYASSNGSQVAKQKVAEFWTVVNYSD